jgi:hypothetical protein
MKPEQSVKSEAFTVRLIAPCGMDCRLCMAYPRAKNRCPGCREGGIPNSKSISRCRIKNCETLARDGKKYCFGCDRFPCDRLSHLDKRYRTKYGMSMIENLESIRKYGIRKFVKKEKAKWTCPGCGAVICVHRPNCISCGRRRR